MRSARRLPLRDVRALQIDLRRSRISRDLRARQTAEVLIDGLRPVPKLAVAASLAPGGAPPAVAKTLDSSAETAAFMLVGHEPGLGELAAWFVGAREPFAFKKGGVCRIDFDGEPGAGHGRLAWLATPAMLRAMGE